MSTIPVYNPRFIQNRPDVVYDPSETRRLFAEDIINTNDQIILIQNYLNNLGPNLFSFMLYEIMRLHSLSIQGGSGYIPFLNNDVLSDNLTVDGGELETVDETSTATFEDNGYIGVPAANPAYLWTFDGSFDNVQSQGSVAEDFTDTTHIVLMGNSVQTGVYIHNRTRGKYSKVTENGDVLTIDPAIAGQTAGDIISTTDLYNVAGIPSRGTTVFGFDALTFDGETSLLLYVRGPMLYPSDNLRVGFAFTTENVVVDQIIGYVTGDTPVAFAVQDGKFTVAPIVFDEEEETIDLGTPYIETDPLTNDTDYLVYINYDAEEDEIVVMLNGSFYMEEGVVFEPSDSNETGWGGIEMGGDVIFPFFGELANIVTFISEPSDDTLAYLFEVWNDGEPRPWVYMKGDVVVAIEDSETYQRTIPSTVKEVTFAPTVTGSFDNITAVIKDDSGDEIVEVDINNPTSIPVEKQEDVKGGTLVMSLQHGVKLHSYYLSFSE